MFKGKGKGLGKTAGAVLVIMAAIGAGGVLSAMRGAQPAAISTLATGNGLYAEYRNLDGSFVTSVNGEGPIVHGYSWQCLGDGMGNSMYEGTCALWAGIWDGWGRFMETLTGYIEAPQTGAFTFHGGADDCLKVTFQDVVVAYFEGCYCPYNFSVNLDEGEFYKIKIEFKNRGGSCNLNMSWTRPDGTSELVPRNYLYAEYPEIIINLDVKPGSYPNSVNPRSRGVIPVAVLTSEAFDATAVDTTTVIFGKTGNETAPVHYAWEDVDGDGDIDLILHFKTQETGIQTGDTMAVLTGRTLGGTSIKGTDSIKTVPKL